MFGLLGWLAPSGATFCVVWAGVVESPLQVTTVRWFCFRFGVDDFRKQNMNRKYFMRWAFKNIFFVYKELSRMHAQEHRVVKQFGQLFL